MDDSGKDTYLVDLSPLLCFLFHETSINTRHNFVKVLARRSRN